MGNAHYTIWRNGQQIEAGYGVEAVCEEAGCDAVIDRGLGCLCGTEPGGGEHSCGGYYCEKHLYMSGDETVGDLCGRDIATYLREHPLTDD
jgi:hypothetical protein